jgi:hypothetical protein
MRAPAPLEPPRLHPAPTFDSNPEPYSPRCFAVTIGLATVLTMLRNLYQAFDLALTMKIKSLS